MLQLETIKKMNVSLNPSSRIRTYLESMYQQLGPGESVQLEPIRELAQKLNTSPKTVHKVYQGYIAKGILKSRVGNGTFLVKPRINRKCRKHKQYVIGVTLESKGIWGSEIYSGILHAAADSSLDISFKSLSAVSDNAANNIISMAGSLDGLILFPIIGSQKVLQEYNNRGKLVVCINPPYENSTSNFVAPDYLGISRVIADAWKKGGRQRILFVSGNLERVVSTRLRLAGLTAGLGVALGNTIQLKVLDIHEKEAEPTRKIISNFIRKTSWVPDAIYCAGDFQAVGAYEAVLEFGLSVPDEVSVFGGTGYELTDTSCPMLTRMHQPLHEMGVQCFKLLKLREKLLGRDVPGKYIRTGVRGMGTTSAIENEVIESYLQHGGNL